MATKTSKAKGKPESKEKPSDETIHSKKFLKQALKDKEKASKKKTSKR